MFSSEIIIKRKILQRIEHMLNDEYLCALMRIKTVLH